MKRQPELTQLLAELREENPAPAIGVSEDGKMTVLLQSDQATRHIFSPDECRLLLSSPSAVDRLHDALGAPEDGHVELYAIEVEPDILGQLEECFATVDEI